MRHAPTLGPYGDKREKNVPIRYSFESRDVMSEELRRDYADTRAVELSMKFIKKEEPKEKE